MRRAFTLVEIMITVVIILILATLGMVGYAQAVDSARQKVCTVNQTVLLKAVENHFVTTGIAPATLGQIKLEHLQKAYAEVKKDMDWLTRFSCLLAKLHAAPEAYAQIDELADLVKFEEMQAYGLTRDVFRCPADRSAGISYGINTGLRAYARWRDVPASTLIIGDCEGYTFASAAGLAARHKANFATTDIALAITKAGHIQTSGSPGQVEMPPPPRY